MVWHQTIKVASIVTPSLCVQAGASWMSCLDWRRQREHWGTMGGASGKSFLKWGAWWTPELSLEESRQGCWEREHEHGGRWISAGNGENIVFSLFCLLSQDMWLSLAPGLCFVLFFFLSSHTLPIPIHTSSVLCPEVALVSSKLHLPLSYRLRSSCPVSNQWSQTFLKGTVLPLQCNIIGIGFVNKEVVFTGHILT